MVPSTSFKRPQRSQQRSEVQKRPVRSTFPPVANGRGSRVAQEHARTSHSIHARFSCKEMLVELRWRTTHSWRRAPRGESGLRFFFLRFCIYRVGHISFPSDVSSQKISIRKGDTIWNVDEWIRFHSGIHLRGSIKVRTVRQPNNKHRSRVHDAGGNMKLLGFSLGTIHRRFEASRIVRCVCCRMGQR